MHGHRCGGVCQQAVGEAGGASSIVRGEGFARFNALCTVGAEDGGAQGKRGFVGRGQHRDWTVAVSAERQQQRALGADCIVAGRIVDGGEPLAQVIARGEAFDADRTLGRRGKPFELRQRMAYAGFAEALEAGGGEQRDVGLTRLQLGQPRGDIAAKADDPEV